MINLVGLIPLIGPLVNGLKEIKGHEHNKDQLSTKIAMPAALGVGATAQSALMMGAVGLTLPEQAALSGLVTFLTYIYCLIRKRC